VTNAAPRVLIADDHPPTRAGVRIALEHGGLEVCAEVANASDAVDAALRERPDVCLLDVQMPGGGMAAASMINRRLPSTVVLMLTVSHEGTDLVESLRQGARGYLLKEMDPLKLPVAVRAALEGEVILPRALASSLVEEVRDGARPRRARQPSDRPGLSRREWDVLELLGEDASTAEIASRLFLSEVTVRRHVSNILRKLDVSTRLEAVRLVRDDVL
jgi:DNA-binding NarL/FixJ family response regulator